jgi:predicted Zn finger-like uncharacterized protein
MQLTCPTCGATYDVPETAIGPNGRKIRCRACETSWFEPAREAGVAPPPPPPVVRPEPVEAPPVAVEPDPAEPPVRPQRSKRPWLLLLLSVLVIVLGAGVASILWGPEQVASRLGIKEDRVPLGIDFTRDPDWRMIAGGGRLVAISGRIYNSTNVEQRVPDVRAELKDRQGKTVYAWTITRPVARLGPGQQVSFDGAAVGVPESSSDVSVSFAGSDAR